MRKRRPCRWTRRRARRQTQVREYPDNQRRLLDGGNDPELPATLRAVFQVELEHALEKTRPAHARLSAVRLFARGHADTLRQARHDRGTQPGIGREHSMKADQVQPRARHECCQALYELQRRHPDVRGAVAPRALELQHDITRAIALEPLVGDRGARDVPAQAFERLALMLSAAHPGMQAEAVRIGAQARGGFVVPAGHGAQAQHLLTGARPQRDAIAAGGRL